MSGWLRTAQVGIMQMSKFKPGTVQKDSSTIDRSSGRDRTDAFTITVQCTEQIRVRALGTHVKISQLAASLQTSRQQVVFARLVTSCQQVWNKLLTTCNNLVDIIRLVTRLYQQGCYNHDVTILLQPCVVNLVTFLLYHDCIRLVGTIL